MPMCTFFPLPLLSLILLCNVLIIKGQDLCSSGATAIYSDQQITITSGIVYGSAIPAGSSTPKDYKYDMYVPPTDDIRYAIVLFSGGGFGGVDRTQMNAYCKEFAKRGIVAFTCDYRTGNAGCGPQQDCACDNKLLAMYRAVQDGRAALRHIAHNAAAYGIDKDHLLIGGESAGAVLSLLIAYDDQSEIDNSLKGGFAALGGIDNSTNALTDTYTISAVLNLWGQAFNSSNTLSIIKSGDAPMISFHGKEDLTCPYGKYSNEFCSFPGKLYGFGSKPISDRMKELGICYELYSDTNGTHGLSASVTDFGLGEIPPTPVPTKKIYVTERAVCFFKSVLCNYCADVTKKNYKDKINTSCTNPAMKLQSILYLPAAISYEMKNHELVIQSSNLKMDVITVFNLPGQKIIEMEVNDYAATINTGNLFNGIYLVVVKSEQGIEVAKISIQ